MTKNDQNMNLSTLVVPNGCNGMERVIGHPGWGFDTVRSVSVRGYPNFGPGAPKMAQKGPKLPKYDRTLTSSTLLVQNGWNGMEQVNICLG